MNILQKKVLPDTIYKMPVYICLCNLGLNFCCLWALWVRVNIILHDSHLFVYPRTNVAYNLHLTLEVSKQQTDGGLLKNLSNEHLFLKDDVTILIFKLSILDHTRSIMHF